MYFSREAAEPPFKAPSGASFFISIKPFIPAIAALDGLEGLTEKLF